MDNKSYKEFMNQDFKSFSDWLFSLGTYEFSAIGSILGFAISKGLTINQLNSLGNFFSLIGQILQTINAQSITVSQNYKKNSNLKPYIEKENITDEVNYIKDELYKIINDLYGNNYL